ncbi:MAG: transposase, partial [Clostridia bacterium]|nr:transposase [Clostridia bacterium]
DTYEVLLTNLTENEFSVSELKGLYAMRWGIETSFRDLKYTLALSYFHSKKTENILQEIFARLIMYNFAELITSHVLVKQKNRKYSYRINFAAAVPVCRNFFLKNISPSDVEALLLMYLLPIRQGSANLRRGSPKSAPSFTYRIP